MFPTIAVPPVDDDKRHTESFPESVIQEDEIKNCAQQIKQRGNGIQRVHEEHLEDESTGQDDSDGEQDEEEEDEPSLKYQRITGAIPDLLKKDSASALAISNKFMVIHFISVALTIMLIISFRRWVLMPVSFTYLI